MGFRYLTNKHKRKPIDAGDLIGAGNQKMEMQGRKPISLFYRTRTILKNKKIFSPDLTGFSIKKIIYF